MKYEEIPEQLIRANPHQPRQFFSQSALEDLAESIRVNGLLQPVMVRTLKGSQTFAEPVEHFEIIAGERRARACRMVGLDLIPCNVMEDGSRRKRRSISLRRLKLTRSALTT